MKRGFVALGLLASTSGCVDCEDELAAFDPTTDTIRWIDESTIELTFEEPLAQPLELELGRFALVGYDVDRRKQSSVLCKLDSCFDPLEVWSPSAVEWDADRPELLRLRWAGPIPVEGCVESSGARGFELVYQDQGPGELLVYASGQPVAAWGNWITRINLEDCLVRGLCWQTDFCAQQQDPAVLDDNRFLACPDFE